MAMPDSKIIALIDGISADNAKKLGSIGIDYIDTNDTGTGFLFYLADNTTVDVPLSMNFLFSQKYDPNKDGSVVKSDTLQFTETDGTIAYVNSEYLLDRANQTNTQDGTTVTVDKTGFNEFLSEFSGNTIQDLASYLDTHKEFINGLFIGDSATEGNFKIISENNKLKLQRLENGLWNTVYTVGSNETDIINLNKQYSAINFKKSDANLNLARISTDNKSIQIGDARLDKLYISAKELLSYKVEDTYTSHNYIINNDTGLTQSLSTWEFTVNIPIQNNFNYCAIHGVEINNTTTGYYNYQIIDVLTGDVAYFGGTDYELKAGLTKQLTQTGLHTEILSKLIHLYCGRQYRFVFTTQAPISFKGGLINSVFNPYCVFKYYLVTADEIVSMESVTDSVSSNNSNLVASAKSVYTLSQAINSISGGMSPIIPISCEDFGALTKGTNGTHYILSNDGAILGETVYKYDNIFIVNTFGETVETERDITTTDYVLIPTDNASKGNIFITDIEPINMSKSVIKTMNTYPNDRSVLSVLSDDNSYKIIVEWDRGEDICGQPKINEKNIIGITNTAGGTYSGYVILNSTDIIDNKITATLNTNTYTIAFSIITPPSISSITFGDLPNSQTELKEGDLIDVTIVADKPIDTVEFQDTGAFQYQSLSVTSDTTVIVSGVISNRGDILQSLTGSIRVKSTEGSWSGITESVATLPLNNIKPSIVINGIDYPIGQQAIKDTESATINYSLTNTDTNTPNIIGDDLSLGIQTDISLIVTRLITGTTTYNDGLTNNISFELVRNANGASINYPIGIAIATIAPILVSQSLVTYNIMSGNGAIINNLTFSQKVKVKSISSLDTNKGTLTTGVTTVYNTLYDLGISSQDSDIHSNNINTTNLVITGMSGLDSSIIPINYYIRGFANKVLNYIYPSLSEDIGVNVVDINKLNISGFILTTPLFEIVKQYESDYININNDTADYYAINNMDLLLPNAVKQFGYTTGTNIQVNISETY